MNGPRIGELCAGYAGISMAVEQVLGGELAWVADNDPGASAILAHRFPAVKNLGDITTVDWAAVEPVDILTAGFPCTDVSAAGARAGLMKGTRSGVWLEVAKAIGVLRPRLVVIENVRGLLTARGDEPTPEHLAAEAARDTPVMLQLLQWLECAENIAITKGDMRRVKECRARTNRVMGLRKRAVARCQWHERRLVRAIGTVLGNLADLGFDAEGCVVSAADAGAPHRRERVFIIAWPAAEDPDRATRDQRRLPESGETESGRSRADTRGPSGTRLAADTLSAGLEIGGVEHHGPQRQAAERSGGELPAAHAEGDGWGEGWPEPARLLGGPHAPVRDSPVAADADGCGLTERTERDSGPLTRLNGALRDDAERRVATPEWATAGYWARPGAFGLYEAAVRQHERAFGRRAPAPVEPGRGGKPRLAPGFAEWMMGLPAGWVTAVPGLSRNDQLHAIGNGVMPQQGAAAIRLLLQRAPEALESLLARTGTEAAA